MTRISRRMPGRGVGPLATPVRVLLPPPGDGPEDPHQVAPHRGEPVLHPSRDHPNDRALNQSETLQPPEPVGDRGRIGTDALLELVEPLRTLLDERPQDRQHVLLPQEAKRPFVVAVRRLRALGGRRHTAAAKRSSSKRLLCFRNQSSVDPARGSRRGAPPSVRTTTAGQVNGSFQQSGGRVRCLRSPSFGEPLLTREQAFSRVSVSLVEVF